MEIIDKQECIFRLEHRFCFEQDITADLEHYVDVLKKWQKAQNLVSRETLDNVWSRHILDSAGLLDIEDTDLTWLDFGSGAGFPGLITALIKKHLGQIGHVYLVESNTRKVAFMRTVIRDLGLSATVYDKRIETVSPKSFGHVDCLSARALSSLDMLFEYSFEFMQREAHCFFHKGREINGEIEEAANSWSFDLVKCKSSLLPESEGVIVKVQALEKIR